MSWHAIRSADGSKWSICRRRRVLQRDVDHVDAVAVAVRRRAVDDQPVIGRIGNAGGGVRAAREIDERHHVRCRRVAEVEDVQALLAGLDNRVAAWPAAGRHAVRGRGIPRARQDLLVDDDVALPGGMPAIAVVDDLLRIRPVLDVDDPEAGERPLVRDAALEGDVRVGQRKASDGRSRGEALEAEVVGHLELRRRRCLHDRLRRLRCEQVDLR